MSGKFSFDYFNPSTVCCTLERTISYVHSVSCVFQVYSPLHFNVVLVCVRNTLTILYLIFHNSPPIWLVPTTVIHIATCPKILRKSLVCMCMVSWFGKNLSFVFYHTNTTFAIFGYGSK